MAAADRLQLPPIPFQSFLDRFGLQLPGLQYVDGITFDHVVAIKGKSPSPSLLFHELVHVAQYRLLGVPRFAHLYVRGFLRSGRYEGIPLERCAWELEARFSELRKPFSVESMVAQWAASELF